MMNYLLLLMVSILFFSCEEDRDSLISNESTLEPDYSVNLDWDDSLSTNKTSVNIISFFQAILHSVTSETKGLKKLRYKLNGIIIPINRFIAATPAAIHNCPPKNNTNHITNDLEID